MRCDLHLDLTWTGPMLTAVSGVFDFQLLTRNWVLLQREKARERAGRAVEAAGRAGDHPQAAGGRRAAGQVMPPLRRRPRSTLMRHILFSLIYSYFLFDYIFVNVVINFLYL